MKFFVYAMYKYFGKTQITPSANALYIRGIHTHTRTNIRVMSRQGVTTSRI